MSPCQRCGLPIIPGPSCYAGPQCKCWAYYGSQDPNRYGAKELKPLTEADVRRIVREELAAEKEESRRKLRAFIAQVHGADPDTSPAGHTKETP